MLFCQSQLYNYLTPLHLLQTPDLTNVVGQTFVFRINNMDVQVSDARKVHVQKGMIEIKY